jgi:hypothetical protein
MMDAKLRAEIDEMHAEVDASIKPHEYDAHTKRFLAAVELAKRGFGQWDQCDPVVRALLRVVTAQSDLSRAITYSATIAEWDDGAAAVEAEIAERRKAIVALQKALEQEPRGFQ